jgi:PPK2 family polyphosphate:nucleotide phosphotransferase
MKPKFSPDLFRIPAAGAKPRPLALSKWPTVVAPMYSDKPDYQKRLKQAVQELAQQQRVLYAHQRYAVLLIFQGLDTAGKDGAIRHVMSGVNPQGVSVHSFKSPSDEELNHDFLWRTTCRLPERGRIGIFNRSYYEEVLIVKANPAVLARQRLPEESLARPDFWRERYQDIVAFEDFLVRNGTRILKFYLHLSKEEQRQRLLARIDDPDKNWKLAPADLEVRDQWDRYQEVYADCLRHTSHDAAPWYCVPADDKRNARLIISRIVAQTLRSLPIAYPEATDAQRKGLRAVRSKLARRD